jgi:hypothetical protein
VRLLLNDTCRSVVVHILNFFHEKDLTLFIYFQEREQEDIFEEVERFRIEASNHYERHDFLGSPTNTKDFTVKFPRATKNTLKYWLFSNQDNPYLNKTVPWDVIKYFLTGAPIPRRQKKIIFVN